ncbi:UDP-glycosyltransferase 82A1-like [Phragmites australis]|uniref:UDP-glycosyltransferase 82A1-like n=1 Tax=Phragmites australis TaxID=29695 RepID=UPI002D77F5DA|nr:UDP-glycosyltransferase 82A1-like [Phragmites australis]
MGAEPKPEPVPVPVRPAVVVLVPFPAQGHVSPMLRLARALAAPGVVAATVAVPDFVHRRIVSASQAESAAGVALASIASGIPDDGDGEPPGFASILHAMEHHMPAHLEGMLKTNQSLTGRGVAFLVLDVLASWAVPVAIRCGVPAVGFWPAMLATYRVVAAIPELIDKGLISDSGIPTATKRLNNDETKVNGDLHKLPAELELSTAELPWLVGDEACQKSRFTFWLRTMERARSLRSILVNTFPGEAASDSGEHLHPSQIPQVLQVGPLPTDSFDRTKGDSHHSPLRIPSMWQADDTCMEWLDQQRPGTVTYVSFGSWVAPIGRDEIKELALGLEATGLPFLWALKDEPSWRGGLPSGYKETVADRGKIVAWAPQEDVLQHEAVGCYLTHCGWNSTLEAIQNGVRLLCCPLSSDQFINCAYIVKMWGIGIRLGSTKRSIVEDGIKRIMEGEEGRRLQEKVNEFRERVMTGEARCASKRNLESFLGGIMRDDLVLGQLSL